MLDIKLTAPGTILMHKGRIHIGGDFKVDGAMCREVAALALLWAIGQMQAELTALIATPGGTGKTSIDLPREVEEALFQEDSDLDDMYGGH